MGHRPTVSGLGLRVGILRHEPLRDFGFAKAKREVQRGISQFILRVDINLRGQLRLGFREVTTQHGEVDFHEAVVALEMCGIMPGQAGAGGRTLCLFLRLISLDRIEAKRRIQLVVVKINFARAGVGNALSSIHRQPMAQRHEKRRDRKKHNKRQPIIPVTRRPVYHPTEDPQPDEKRKGVDHPKRSGKGRQRNREQQERGGLIGHAGYKDPRDQPQTPQQREATQGVKTSVVRKRKFRLGNK